MSAGVLAVYTCDDRRDVSAEIVFPSAPASSVVAVAIVAGWEINRHTSPTLCEITVRMAARTT